MKKRHSSKPLQAIVLIVASFISYAFAAFGSGENYKDWNYSPTSVVGLIRLDNTANRSFYKITRMNEQSTKVQQYNAAGIVTNTTVVRFFNGSLKLIAETDQWGKTYQTTKFTYLGNGIFNVTETNTGKNSYLPCKSVKYIYKNNLLAEKRYLSYSGKLCNNSDGFAITKYKRYTDKNRFSLIMEQSFYGPDSSPVMAGSYDCHKLVYQRDERGNEVAVAYFGINDEPLTNRYGGFKSKYEYDQNDNYTTSLNIGLDEEPAPNAYGVVKTTYTYKNGFIAEETRFDNKNKIVRSSSAGDGIAIIKNEYDDRGNYAQISYYDENGRPINNHSGIQKIIYQYSPLNMLVGIEYFDNNNAAATNVSGIHRYRYVRDNKGQLIQAAYFDKGNSPVENKSDHVYMIKYKYDEYGRLSSESYWHDSTTRMKRWNGYHETITKYNQDGQVNEYLYFDENGNSCKTNNGYSRKQLKYNADATENEIRIFDNNIPVMLTGAFVSKYHCIKYFYKADGRVASVEYFDINDKPTDAAISLTDEFNCHKIEFAYQGDRVIQEYCYLANNNTPAKIIDCLKNDYVSVNGVNESYKNQ